MPKIIEGSLSARGLRLAVVVSRFNHFITDKLFEGAMDVLRRSDADEESITVVKVPGSFEIPLAAQSLARSGKYDAIVCLGAVIQGETKHFDLVAQEVAKGIASVSLESGVPVAFGVVTAENIEQAIERAGTKSGNKGGEAARVAVEMANLMKGIGKRKGKGGAG